MPSIDEIENTSESILNKQIFLINRFFWFVFVIMGITTFLVFLLKVDITIVATGIVRPQIEKTEVKSVIAAPVKRTFVSDGDFVSRGDTLLMLDKRLILNRLSLLYSQLDNSNNQLFDLRKLLMGDFKNVKTTLYSQELFQYKKQVFDIELKLLKNNKELERSEQLYKKGFVSDKEYEEAQYGVSSLTNEIRMKKDMFHSKWESELLKNKMDSIQFKTQLNELKNQKKYYAITAPYDGTIEQIKSITNGTYITAGQVILVLSPNVQNVAEFYLEPKDIGFVRKNQKVKVMFDAFNYAEWGMINTKVFNVSEDYVQLDKKIFFKVKCKLKKKNLYLKSGVKGIVKKGMTIRGHFLITSRPLYRLLFDNVNQWLNPTMN